MTLVWICTILVLVAVLVGIYFRLAPLQAFVDERKARQGMQEGSGQAGATEREELFRGLRTQIRELNESIYLERAIANERQGQLEAGRAAFHALVAQLNEERLAVEGICLDLNAERVDLQDALYCALGRERVDRAVQEIQASRARGESTSAQGRKRRARAEEEETKREGPARAPATPAREHGAQGQQGPTPTEEPIAPEGDGQMESARLTALPTTPEAIAEQRDLVATTAAEDVDADDDATRAMSSSAVAQALHADAGDAEEGDDDLTLSHSRDAMVQALGAGAGGATRPPQTPPRAVHAVAVAPPASAPPPLPIEPALKAAGLRGPAQSAPAATPPAPRRSGTLVGMPTVSAPAPAEGGPEGGSSSFTEEALRGGDGVPATVPGRRLQPHEETPGRLQPVKREARK